MIKQDFIPNAENEKLFIEYYIPEKAKSTILFCHGITGCRKGRTKDDDYFQVLAKKLMQLNYKVVLFDSLCCIFKNIQGKEPPILT